MGFDLAKIGPFKPARLVAQAGWTNFFVPADRDSYRSFYAEIAATERTGVINARRDTVEAFKKIAKERDIHFPNTLTPYWSPDDYNPLELIATLAQFVDYYDNLLPKTTLPPEEDVKAYIDTVMNMEGKVTLSQQFEILLDIANNNFLGALNIGMIASRVMARGLDKRAYPNIPQGVDEMRAGNSKIAQFEHAPAEKNDAPGDTYYFWTNMFGTYFFENYKGIGSRVYKHTIKKATQLMKTARRLAGSPVNGDYATVSDFGREMGLLFVGQDRQKFLAK